jgi:hypothetical protein
MGASQSEPQEGDESDGQSVRLYNVDFTDKHWPIIYTDEYNISFAGLERMHPFDSGKWGKICKYLKGLCFYLSTMCPRICTIVDSQICDTIIC